jgi:predicted DNA-binding WGR domain protein
MFDLATGLHRLRPITDTKLDLARLQYRNVREKVAHDLLGRRNSVKIVSETRIAGEGLALVGEVTVSEDKRDYRPQMLLADEGSPKRVSCTCAGFRKDGLKSGPCVHLIAFRMAHAEKEAKKAKTGAAVTFETRAFTRRDGENEHLMQLTLERSKLKVRWGQAGQPMRSQTLKFNTDTDARQSFFARLAELESRGYMDAIAE